MGDFFRKTDAGRRELRERRLGLPRVARNLLLIIDGTRTVRDWVLMVQGASLSDAAALAELGLIEPGLGRAPGDSELAGLAMTAPAPLSGAGDFNTAPAPLDASWTRPGRLSELGGLPPPGSQPRHAVALGSPLPTLPVVLDSEPAVDIAVGGPPAAARQRTAPVLGASAAVPTAASASAAIGSPGPTGDWDSARRAVQAMARRPSEPLVVPTPQRRVPPMPNGLLTAAEGPPSSLPPDESMGFAPLDAAPVAGGRSALGYSELYDSLNALVRETLGLLKGYRYTLRIERAQNVTELESVAAAFVVEVRRLRGDSMARMVERALGIGS
ncbi:MAG TPA: hypothetical protein PLW24_16810 [Burkholderiaceae bacterium]|nr:hypothetical protein [Burkholderiaceae bacterium]HNG81137.1 hypothetical protein [Burkholderiaceae bacterium]